MSREKKHVPGSGPPIRGGSRGLALGTIMLVVIAAMLAVAAAAAEAATTEFSSSFEASDRPLDWTSTAETDAAGQQEDVRRHRQLDAPESRATSPTRSTPSRPAARTRRTRRRSKAFDGDVNTKWLAFAADRLGPGRARRAASTVVRYALTSANDAPGRDPQGLDAPGLQRRPDLDDARHADRPGLRRRASRPRSTTFANTTAYSYYRLDVTAQPRRRHHPARRAAALRRRRPRRRRRPTEALEVGSGPISGPTTPSPAPASPASRPCGTPAATPPTAAATPTTRSSTSTSPVTRDDRAVLPDLPGAHRAAT